MKKKNDDLKKMKGLKKASSKVKSDPKVVVKKENGPGGIKTNLYKDGKMFGAQG